MTTKIIYIADDGTEFNNEKECQEYELKSSIDMTNLQKYVHFFDENRKEIHFGATKKCIVNAFRDCIYIRIDNANCIDSIIKICGEDFETPWVDYRLSKKNWIIFL